jgi:hypothetical protein
MTYDDSAMSYAFRQTVVDGSIFFQAPRTLKRKRVLMNEDIDDPTAPDFFAEICPGDKGRFLEYQRNLDCSAQDMAICNIRQNPSWAMRACAGLPTFVPTLLRKSKLVLLKKGSIKDARLALPIEHMAMQCFPVLIGSAHHMAADFPFREDSGMGLQTTGGVFTNSHVISMSGNAMNFHQLMAVMLFKLATTHRI